MAKPTLVQNLSTRLRPLRKPAVWAPLTICALLGIFSWEVYNNPDWFNRAPKTDLTAGSELTPEEQARLSEIDTIDTLLESTQATGDLPSSAELADSTGNEQSILEIPDPQADDSLASKADPFATYRADYEFPSARQNGTSGLSSSLSAGSAGNSSSLSGNTGAASAPATLSESELSKALARQQSLRGTEANSRSDQGPTPQTSTAQSATDSIGTGSGNSFEPASALPVESIPGSFLRTTSEMSPPVGTTGYTQPSTTNLPAFNIDPPQPTRNPLNAVPAAPIGQVAPAPAAQPPAAAIPGSTVAPSGTVYTPPSFTQPDQGRPINPRRF